MTTPPLVTRDALVEGLRAAGVEVGSVGGQAFREVVADRLLTSGILRDPATLADDEALVERVMAERFRYVCMHGDDNEVSRIAETYLWLRALAAALTEDPS